MSNIQNTSKVSPKLARNNVNGQQSLVPEAPKGNGAEVTSTASLMAEIERLKAQNEALKLSTASKQGLSVKVTAKGGIAVYGLGRFPVTLYASQWEKLMGEDVTTKVKTIIADGKAGKEFPAKGENDTVVMTKLSFKE